MQARLALEHGRPVFLLALAARPGMGAAAGDASRDARRSHATADHRDRRAADIRPARSCPSAGHLSPTTPPRTAAMPTVGELTAIYGNFMLNPRRGPGVCRTCFNFTDGYDRLLRVRARRDRPRRRRADLLQRRARAAPPRPRELQAPERRGRTAGSRAELAAVLWRHLAAHEALRRGTPRGVDRFRARDDGPVRRPRARRASSAATDRRQARRADARSPTSGCSRAPTSTSAARTFDPDKFEAIRQLDGEPVLLIDDTWTTGRARRAQPRRSSGPAPARSRPSSSGGT